MLYLGMTQPLIPFAAAIEDNVASDAEAAALRHTVEYDDETNTWACACQWSTKSGADAALHRGREIAAAVVAGLTSTNDASTVGRALYTVDYEVDYSQGDYFGEEPSYHYIAVRDDNVLAMTPNTTATRERLFTELVLIDCNDDLDADEHYKNVLYEALRVINPNRATDDDDHDDDEAGQ